MTATCDYCDTDELVYEFHPGRGGTVYRCIECIAVERGQSELQMPFGRWLERDEIEPMHEDDDFEAFDPREDNYLSARAWFTVLARLKDDEPIVKRDPEAIGMIHDGVRDFLINVMGKEAHKRPSELRSDGSAKAPKPEGSSDGGEP